MRLYQRKNGYWYAEFDRNHPKSLGTKDRIEAKRLFNSLRKEYLKGQVALLERTKTITLQEFKDEYLSLRKPPAMAEATWKADDLGFRKLLDHIGDRRLSKIGEKSFDEFVSKCRQMGNKKVSINAHLRHLKAAFSKAVKWDYLTKNPLQDYEFPTPEKRKPHVLERNSILKFSKNLDDPEVRLFGFTSLLTGLRRYDVFNLDYSEIHIDGPEPEIRRRNTKGESDIIIPMHPLVVALYRPIMKPNGQVFTRWEHIDTYSKKIKQALRAAGLEDYRLHDLRHTFATMVAEISGDERDVQMLLGHRDVKTSRLYIHLAKERAKRGRLHDIMGQIQVGTIQIK